MWRVFAGDRVVERDAEALADEVRPAGRDAVDAGSRLAEELVPHLWHREQHDDRDGGHRDGLDPERVTGLRGGHGVLQKDDRIAPAHGRLQHPLRVGRRRRRGDHEPGKVRVERLE
jgi:hypothetical protein